MSILEDMDIEAVDVLDDSSPIGLDLPKREEEEWEEEVAPVAEEPTTGDILTILARSIWHQGLRSSYRRAYWKFFLRMFGRYTMNRGGDRLSARDESRRC